MDHWISVYVYGELLVRSRVPLLQNMAGGRQWWQEDKLLFQFVQVECKKELKTAAASESRVADCAEEELKGGNKQLLQQ